jgi:protein-disulfide isomerase
MTPTRRIGFAVALLLLTACNQKAATAPAGDPKHSAVPQSTRDWSQTVSATPDGGFMMGNPAAKVKLIEFASLTCPHCGAFNREAVPQLIANYVKPGLVSYEVRTFARDPLDLAASMLVRCGGAGPFFKLIDQMFAEQDRWLTDFQKAAQPQAPRLEKLPQDQVPLELAKLAGLDRFVAMRGVPPARAHQCLTDVKAQERVAEIRSAAVKQFDIDGTPSFIVNGEKADGVHDFETLEPRLQQALGS